MVDLIAENDEDMRDLLEFLHGEQAEHNIWVFQGQNQVTQVDPPLPSKQSLLHFSPDKGPRTI